MSNLDGSAGGIPDIPMPPSNTPTASGNPIPDIPMPPSNLPTVKPDAGPTNGFMNIPQAQAFVPPPSGLDIPMPPSDAPVIPHANNNDNGNAGGGAGGSGGGGGVPDFDELNARFAALSGK